MRLPPLPLRRYVASYTGYKQVGDQRGRHRGLPSPYLTLILTIDEPLWLAESSGGAPSCRYDALIGGLHTTPAHVVHEGSQSGIQLALTPRGARALLGVPAAEFAHRNVHALDVLGDCTEELREKLWKSKSWDQRFTLLERWLTTRVVDAGGATLAPEIAESLRRLTAPEDVHGFQRVEQVARDVGWSTRHLRNRLHAEVGIAPKVVSRLARFHRARRVLQRRVGAGRPAELATIAATCGYADQAHLAREFRQLAGCPPSVWVLEEFPNVQSGVEASLAESSS